MSGGATRQAAGVVNTIFGFKRLVRRQFNDNEVHHSNMGLREHLRQNPGSWRCIITGNASLPELLPLLPQHFFASRNSPMTVRPREIADIWS